MGDKQLKKWELVEEVYPGISEDKLASMEKGQMLEFLGFIMNTYRFNEDEKETAIGHLIASNGAKDNAAFLYTLAMGAKKKAEGVADGNSPIRKNILEYLDSIDTAAAYLALNPTKGGKKYRKKRTKRKRRTRGKKRTKSRSKSRRKSKRRKRRKSRRKK